MANPFADIICPQCGAIVFVEYGLAPDMLREARRLQSMRLGTIARCRECDSWFVLGSSTAVEELMTTDPDVASDGIEGEAS